MFCRAGVHRASSKAWVTTQNNDRWVREAALKGYRCRSAFKLLQLDDRCGLFHRGATTAPAVVDLGCCPGSWAQVARERLGPRAAIVGVDVLGALPLPGATFIKGDFTQPGVQAKVREAVGNIPLDVVMSDMSPNRCGVSTRDGHSIADLDGCAIDFALSHLKCGGHFVCKVLGGEDYYRPVLATAREWFDVVRTVTPEACRDTSQEHYLVALHYRGRRGAAKRSSGQNGDRYGLDTWPGFSRRSI